MKRLMACLIVRDGIVVQSLGFARYLPVGRLSVAVEFLNAWGIDEITVLNISRATGAAPEADLIREATRKCFVPVSVGGGIRSVDHIHALMHAGADKVVLNLAAIDDPALIERGARLFGDQCIVVSIDAKRTGPGRWEAYTEGGRRPTGRTPEDVAVRSAGYGAGEILITSIDRDGSKTGYDIPLIRRVADAVSVPVIACGGAGHPRHFAEALRIPNVSAAAAGNYYHFTEHSAAVTKGWLLDNGVSVRPNSAVNYAGFDFGEDGRISRPEDEYLADLAFEYIEPERI